MDEYSDNDEPTQKGHVKLKEGFDLNALLNGQGDTFQINFESVEEDVMYNPRDVDVSSDVAGVCLGLDSDDNEDEDLNSTPFEKIAIKMTNVTDDGKIKKKIKRPGVGDTPPCDSIVSVLYSSYLEYNDEPTDFAYVKKPYNFRLGHAVLFGLNIAVQSMKVNEKALFLIHPDYAFGKMGHPPRIPPNASFLFQIELLRFVDSGPALEFSRLSMEDKRKFPVAHKTALGLIENAKEYFKHNLKLSIREYNKAVSLLEECTLTDMEEQVKQQKLLFKLYSNLAVCYTKDGNPRKACTMCNNIYAIARNTSLSIPAKVYFHNGRALFMLGDWCRAKQKLLQAQKLEPHNADINKELLKVTTKMAEEASKERHFAKAFLSNTNQGQGQGQGQDGSANVDTFKLEIRKLCDNLRNDNTQTHFKLPNGLTDKEKETAKTVATLAKLQFIESENNIIISKLQ